MSKFNELKTKLIGGLQIHKQIDFWVSKNYSAGSQIFHTQKSSKVCLFRSILVNWQFLICQFLSSDRFWQKNWQKLTEIDIVWAEINKLQNGPSFYRFFQNFFLFEKTSIFVNFGQFWSKIFFLLFLFIFLKFLKLTIYDNWRY